MMNRVILRGAVLFSGMLLIAGCNKTDNSMSIYRSAIDNYYQGHPVCLWSESKKFPIQAATSDNAKTEGYDALTDAGLLVRTTGEKKEFIIASKQVNNYDISSKGRAVWTQDPSQPGYGNFCYGQREVTSIESSTPANAPSPGTEAVQVNYRYKIGDVPSWADTQEMRTAFPDLNSGLSGPHVAQATLMQSGNSWQVLQKGSAAPSQ